MEENNQLPTRTSNPDEIIYLIRPHIGETRLKIKRTCTICMFCRCLQKRSSQLWSLYDDFALSAASLSYFALSALLLTIIIFSVLLFYLSRFLVAFLVSWVP